jgi:alpha-D-ribose 1-methylphosphonate 5-triphosphate synthase subunit PhnG
MYENFGKGRQTEQARILGLLDALFQTAPMRGDVALSDLRRLIVGNANESAQ